AEAHQRPAGDQEDEVPGQDQQQHREDEDVHVAEEAGVAGVVLVLHVADGVADDEPADPGDDEAHEDRQVVDQDVEGHVEAAALDPGPVGEVARCLAREQGEDEYERSPNNTRTDEHGEDARQAPTAAGKEQRTRGWKDEDQQRQRLVAHPLSSLRSSTSSASRVRKMSTKIASPTTASAAATVIDMSANSWPSMFCSWREKVTSARLAALSMSSIEIRITSGLRRMRTPTVPSVKRMALSKRNQDVSRCDPPMSSVLIYGAPAKSRRSLRFRGAFTGRRRACG